MPKFDQLPEKQALRRREFMAMGAGCSAMAALGSVGVLAETLTQCRLDGEQTSAHPVDSGLRPPTPLGRFSPEQFSGLVGETFATRDERGNAMAARLKEVNPSENPGTSREAFSVVFDLDQGGLKQGNYRVTHNQLDDAELFMVPVDLTGHFSRLEAVFS